MGGTIKTNALRLLDNAGISYRTKEYEVDENDLSGTAVAQKTGLAVEMVFKTLVATGDKSGYLVFCIPVADELDLKKAAAASGNKRVEMLHLNQPVGGNSPFRRGARLPDDGKAGRNN